MRRKYSTQRTAAKVQPKVNKKLKSTFIYAKHTLTLIKESISSAAGPRGRRVKDGRQAGYSRRHTDTHLV